MILKYIIDKTLSSNSTLTRIAFQEKFTVCHMSTELKKSVTMQHTEDLLSIPSWVHPCLAAPQYLLLPPRCLTPLLLTLLKSAMLKHWSCLRGIAPCGRRLPLDFSYVSQTWRNEKRPYKYYNDKACYILYKRTNNNGQITSGSNR